MLDLVRHLGGDLHRASADFAFHVLEVLERLDGISPEDGAVEITSTVKRPAPLLDAEGKR
ncbi:hypothetical protein ACH4TX_04475 [Streptomyces sp. NPDC021098]|uniref:hypothetical protein n=1 Tax=unclassified Streptomyces TaxID=2593676 RepID=UPI0037A81B70